MSSIAVAAVLAGVLTVLAPCIVAALPIILGHGAKDFSKARRVVTGLSISVFVFTLLLKVSTVLLGVSSNHWQLLSGTIIIFVGISYVWPTLYANFARLLKIEQLSVRSQQQAFSNTKPYRDYLVGAALGPVFSACSPTYALIVAVIFPSSIIEGIWYLLLFILGLAVALLLIAYGGNQLISRLGWALDTSGIFRRGLGAMLILLGVIIAFGWEKDILGYLVERGWYDWQLELEEAIR